MESRILKPILGVYCAAFILFLYGPMIVLAILFGGLSLLVSKLLAPGRSTPRRWSATPRSPSRRPRPGPRSWPRAA
jgi:hypothetical protein